jgi:hypothetical protein
MSATVAIVGAIIAAAGAITSSAMQNKAQREAKEESKNLALIARDDELDKQFKDYKMNLEGLQLNKENLALKNREMQNTVKLNNKMMRQTQISNLTSALKLNSKSDQNMTNFIMSLYGKAGGV